MESLRTRAGRHEGECLTDEELARVASGQAEPPPHLNECVSCFEALVAALDGLELTAERCVTVFASDERLRIVGPGIDEVRPLSRTRTRPALGLVAAEAGGQYGGRGTRQFCIGNVTFSYRCAHEPDGVRMSLTLRRSRLFDQRIVRAVVTDELGGLLAAATLRAGDTATFACPRGRPVRIGAAALEGADKPAS
jgi:hypothetical protein